MWKKRKGFTPHAGVLFPSDPVSQYRCMKLPKTDDNDRAYRNYTNTLYLDIWSMLFSEQVSHLMCKSLVLESEYSCASSNIVLWEENNLPPITDWFFPLTDFKAGCCA